MSRVNVAEMANRMMMVHGVEHDNGVECAAPILHEVMRRMAIGRLTDRPDLAELRIPGQPVTGSPDFPRWLNGDLSNFCGHAMHDHCRGSIRTIGIECSCLCKCHEEAAHD